MTLRPAATCVPAALRPESDSSPGAGTSRAICLRSHAPTPARLACRSAALPRGAHPSPSPKSVASRSQTPTSAASSCGGVVVDAPNAVVDRSTADRCCAQRLGSSSLSHLNLSNGPCGPTDGAVRVPRPCVSPAVSMATSPSDSRPGVDGPVRSGDPLRPTVCASATSSAERFALTSPPPAPGANLSTVTAAFGACTRPFAAASPLSAAYPPTRVAWEASMRPACTSRPPGPHPTRNAAPWKDCASVSVSIDRSVLGLKGRSSRFFCDAFMAAHAMAYAVCMGGSRRLPPAVCVGVAVWSGAGVA